MKKKYINTKKIERWKKIERATYLIPVLFCIYYFMISFSDETMFESSIYMVLVIIALAVLLTLPLMIFWKAVSLQLKKTNIQQSTFRAVADLEYYRDKLSGLTPAEISVLTDLQIEPQKDIAALLLQYQLKGIIEIENDTITVLNLDHPSLFQSDKLLLNEVSKGNGFFYGNHRFLEEWKRLAFKEACRRKWFKTPEISTKPTPTGCLGGLLFFIGPLLTLAAIEYWAPVKYFYDFAESAPDTSGNVYLAQALANDPALLKGFFIGMPVILFGFACFFLPLIGLIYAFINMKNNPKIARTAEGNELTEYIYGMKNFIHDFSNLSMAEKEHLVIWDDFLIYAVVLEENEQIVREMFQLRSLEISDYFNPIHYGKGEVRNG